MRLEALGDLMAQLGPALDPLDITEFPELRSWGIAVDEDLAVLVDWVEDQNKLVLSVELGRPPSGVDRGPLNELLLRHNYLWDRTGGVRFALDAPDGDVVQIVDVATEGLELSSFAGMVQVFIDAARAWREIVTRAPQAPSLDVPDFEGPMIRV